MAYMAPATPARFIAAGNFCWFDWAPPPAPENSVGARNGSDLPRWIIILRPIDQFWANSKDSSNFSKRRGTGRDTCRVTQTRR